MHKNILDKKRQNQLPKFTNLKEDFYLAGGTGLALQIGHRKSVDFDFFRKEKFDTDNLFREISAAFDQADIVRVEEAVGTLTVLIDNVQVSFFHYPYPLVDDVIETEFIRIASLQDIGCMKLSAVVSRATNKDYVDLYYLLKDHTTLESLLQSVQEKMPDLDENLVLKSLVYFEDVTEEPLEFEDRNPPSFTEVKEFLRQTVKNYE
jgi:hypothetical protein